MTSKQNLAWETLAAFDELKRGLGELEGLSPEEGMPKVEKLLELAQQIFENLDTLGEEIQLSPQFAEVRSTLEALLKPN